MIDIPRYSGHDSEAKTDLDHFGNCPVCGALVDMRDLAQVMARAHGQEAENWMLLHWTHDKPD
jgi:hypothetical protein